MKVEVFKRNYGDSKVQITHVLQVFKDRGLNGKLRSYKSDNY